MKLRLLRAVLIAGLLLTTTAVTSADDSLALAYNDILRGDCGAGRAVLDRLGPSKQTDQLRGWLQAYDDVLSSRRELKAKTFQWNVEQAKKVLTEDRDNRVVLALNFAVQAAAYASSREEFAAQPWIKDLTNQVMEQARQFERDGRRSDALTCYALLARIHEDDQEYEDLVDQTARYVRVERTYEDREALDKRIKDVDRALLRTTVRMIHHLYYQDPDFKKMAGGGLDYLTTLCAVTDLREYLDGLGNPTLREHFLRKLTELRAELRDEQHYSYKDVLRLFNQITAINKESIELPEQLLIVEFTEGLLSELDDYTNVIWPADSVNFDKMMMGGFEGIGIQLGLDERTNRLKVVTPLENSPALEAGIQPDDLIINVDGKSTKGWTTEDAVNNIMGPAGSEVILTVLRPSNGKEIAFTLSRRQITLTTVRGVNRMPDAPDTWNYMLDDEAGAAYVRLTNFHHDSTKELLDALKAAKQQGMRGLILDLRHNPGGMLDVVIEIVSAFLDKGEVVSTRGRLDSEHRKRIGGPAPYGNIPMVVLVNDGSASASEILAGALQDHHRAVILGTRTFGKGMVQHIRQLSEAARFKLTTALYYLPSGRSPHKAPDATKWGVDPDWELKLTPKELRRVFERERENYIIHNEVADGGNEVLSEEEREKALAALKADDEDDDEHPPLLSEADIKYLDSDPNKAPDADPQLETALLLIRVKLAAGVPWPRDLAVAESHDD